VVYLNDGKRKISSWKLPLNRSVSIPCRFATFPRFFLLIGIQLLNAITDRIRMGSLQAELFAERFQLSNYLGDVLLLLGEVMDFDGIG